MPDHANLVPECAPFTTRAAPMTTVPFRQAVQLASIKMGFDDQLRIGCVLVPPGGLEPSIALDLRFEQTWAFKEAMVGDLHSTLALAPREHVQLEIRNTQRKVLEQDTIDEVENLSSSEATTADKDTVNVARSSSTNNNWHIDGEGSFSVGGLSIGANAGMSSAVTQAATSTVEHVHEAT